MEKCESPNTIGLQHAKAFSPAATANALFHQFFKRPW